jgi:hypothetical protein
MHQKGQEDALHGSINNDALDESVKVRKVKGVGDKEGRRRGILEYWREGMMGPVWEWPKGKRSGR